MFAEITTQLVGLERADPGCLMRAAKLFRALADHYEEVAEKQLDAMERETLCQDIIDGTRDALADAGAVAV